MEQDKSKEPQERKENEESNHDNGWINKAEAFIDQAADKVHQSEAYRKAGKSIEGVTLKIFRQAGRWWKRNG